MPENIDKSGKKNKALTSEKNNSRDGRGGARKGAGKRSLESKNMEYHMVKLSLLKNDWDKIDGYLELRSDTKFKVEIIRDILSSVIEILNETGLSEFEQAEATHDLKEFLKNHFTKRNGEQ
ncbi:hypothetical protein ACTHQ2_22340 [Bacillus subtilis]|uniref:hypothetical protein n=1 Tax=Bacillus subtilis TaxID=1423 RepID=UPI003F7CA76B